jgi:hypothetical protein
MTAPLALVPPLLIPFKVCPCCKAGLTEDEWAALPFKGFQELLGESKSELRDCKCGSTIQLPHCWFCDEVVGEKRGSECECGAITCCADCGPAKHGCNGDDGRDFTPPYEP